MTFKRLARSNIKGVQTIAFYQHAAVVCENGEDAGERMMGLLEGREEAILGEFDSEEVASTLWAYATMGTKPGKGSVLWGISFPNRIDVWDRLYKHFEPNS